MNGGFLWGVLLTTAVVLVMLACVLLMNADHQYLPVYQSPELLIEKQRHGGLRITRKSRSGLVSSVTWELRDYYESTNVQDVQMLDEKSLKIDFDDGRTLTCTGGIGRKEPAKAL